jgi:nucleotide-binding universal stress UspA family protein
MGTRHAVTHGSESSKAEARTEEETRSPVVGLLVDHRSASLIAARRAVNMANALGARVDIIVAIPKNTSGEHPALVLSHLSYLVEALRPEHGFSLDVVHGSLEQAATTLTSNPRPLLVVVDPVIGASATTSLVEALGAPVLVARDPRHGEIVAATDMQSGAFPVLRLARRYAKALGRSVSEIPQGVASSIIGNSRRSVLVTPLTRA